MYHLFILFFIEIMENITYILPVKRNVALFGKKM